MNEKLNEIYESFYGKKPVKAKILLSEFEPIKAEFDKESFEDYDEYFKITRMVSDYAIALVKIKQSDKSIHYLDKAISLMKQNEKLKNKNLFSEPMYESLIFHRGIAFYDLKKHKSAFGHFKELVNNFSDNETYQNWKNASKLYIFAKLEWISIAMIAIISVFTFIVKPERRILNPVLLVGLAVSLIGSIIIYFIKKKLKKNVKYTL